MAANTGSQACQRPLSGLHADVDRHTRHVPCVMLRSIHSPVWLYHPITHTDPQERTKSVIYQKACMDRNSDDVAPPGSTTTTRGFVSLYCGELDHFQGLCPLPPAVANTRRVTTALTEAEALGK